MQIYKLIENNNSCFTAKFAAKNRENLDYWQSQLDALGKGQVMFSKWTQQQLNKPVDSTTKQVLKTFYSSYGD